MHNLPVSSENGRRKTDLAPEFLACKPPRLVLRFFRWMEVLPLDGSTVLCT